jgi:hypothetical protein
MPLEIWKNRLDTVIEWGPLRIYHRKTNHFNLCIPKIELTLHYSPRATEYSGFHFSIDIGIVYMRFQLWNENL